MPAADEEQDGRLPVPPAAVEPVASAHVIPTVCDLLAELEIERYATAFASAGYDDARLRQTATEGTVSLCLMRM